MSNVQYRHSSGQDAQDKVSAHCRQLFSSLPRSDQRRWAEVYVRGLLTVPGRKTVKRISSHVAGGGAEQCLQQFVNQSTWQSDAIRRKASLWLSAALNPSFWIVEDVVIPKNGRNSVGVDRQFAYPEGRAVNCQLGLGLFLSAGDWNCPVNWRLLLPASWENDPERRSKARVPPTVGHQSRWQHMLDVIDEAAGWGVPRRPVLGDLTAEPDAERFIHGLEERRLPFAVKVDVNRPALMAPAAAKTITFGQLIEHARRRDPVAANGWHTVPNSARTVRVVAAPLMLPRPRCLVAEWSTGSGGPPSVWVTSFSPRDIQFPLAGIEQWSRLRIGMQVLYEDLGLRHFEGRSFGGWHHYATLVTAAASCRVLPGQYRDGLEVAPAPTG